MKTWIELAVAAVAMCVFRDRIILAVLILVMPKSWSVKVFAEAIKRVQK